MSPAYIPAPLRRLVTQRADGQCEYCLLPAAVAFAAHEIDHIISLKHGGTTASNNLALSCALCNKHKGSDLASLDHETGDIVPLYHPRRNRWSEHFQVHGAQFVPRTPTGRVTINLLRLNRLDRVEERTLLIAAKLFHLPNETSPQQATRYQRDVDT